MNKKPQPKTLWAVMKAYGWGSITAGSFPLTCPPEGPHKFIPVFNTREQAVAWAGSDAGVSEIEIIASPHDALPKRKGSVLPAHNNARP